MGWRRRKTERGRVVESLLRGATGIAGASNSVDRGHATISGAQCIVNNCDELGSSRKGNWGCVGSRIGHRIKGRAGELDNQRRGGVDWEKEKGYW